MDVKPTSGTLPHYPHLDALRGIAATGVIFVHAAAFGNGLATKTWENTLAASGQRGVQLFYVVSAFTIFLSLDSRSRNESKPTRNFFIRRFFRIAPLYYLAIIANILLQRLAGITSEYGPDNPRDIVMAFTFTHGLSPRSVMHGALAGWSIGIEVAFYAIAPLLFLWVTNLTRALILVLTASAFFPVCSFILDHLFFHTQEWSSYLWFYSPGIEMPVFCFGILAYYLWKARGLLQDVRPVTASLFLLAIAAEIFISSLPNSYTTMLWSSLAFVPLILGLSLHPWKAIVNPVTVEAGKISYSIYLLHPFIIIAIKQVLLKTAPHLLGTMEGLAIILVGTLMLTPPIAWVSYHIIEKPGIRIGKNLILYLENRAEHPRIPMQSVPEPDPASPASPT